MGGYRGYGADKRNALDEVDIQLIAALGLGLSQDEAGRFVCTVEYPNGVTARTVRNRIASKPQIYERNRLKIATVIHRAREEFRQITRDELRREIEKLRHKAVRVKELGLDHAISNPGDTAALQLGNNAADSLLDRDLGRATQTHRIEGEVAHTHQIWGQPQSARALAAQDKDMEESRRLLESGLPADAIEAEIV